MGEGAGRDSEFLRAWVRGRLDLLRREFGTEGPVWNCLLRDLKGFTDMDDMACQRFLKRMRERGELQ